MSERDHKEHELKAALTLIGELRASEAVCAHPCTHAPDRRPLAANRAAYLPGVPLWLLACVPAGLARVAALGRAGRAFLAIAVAPRRHFAFGAVCSVAVECSSLVLSMLSLLRVLLQERQS